MTRPPSTSCWGDDGSPCEHALSVAALAAIIARRMGLPEEGVGRCALAGLLHDLGKAFLPEEILHKPDPLSDEDWQRLREHPERGAAFLRSLSSALGDLATIVESHHERPDGRGYPGARRGRDLPLEAKIVAVCDAWAAMRSTRPYRPALSFEQALAELRAGRGSQFDSGVVDALVSVLCPAGTAARRPREARASLAGLAR